MTKKKSTVNKAGNYTKPGMRKKIFNRIKSQASHGTGAANGQPEKHRLQLKHTKKLEVGISNGSFYKKTFRYQ